MVSLAANWDPAGRRECNDAHLHGGIELDDRPDLLRGWRRFDYGHRIPVGNTGSRMNTRRACAGGPQWRNYRARPRPRKTQRGGALCPGPKLPVRRTYQALLAKSTNMIFYEVQNRRISVGNVPHDKQSRKPWSACPDCSEDLNEDIKTQPPYVKCPFCGAPIQPIWW